MSVTFVTEGGRYSREDPRTFVNLSAHCAHRFFARAKMPMELHGQMHATDLAGILQLHCWPQIHGPEDRGQPDLIKGNSVYFGRPATLLNKEFACSPYAIRLAIA